MPVQNYLDRQSQNNNTTFENSAKTEILSTNSNNDNNITDTTLTPQINVVAKLDRNLITIELFGHTIKSLLDTGANVSCCSLQLLQSFGVKSSEFQPSPHQNALGVGGEKHKILGSIDLPIVIGSLSFVHTFQVFEKLYQSVILGVDFMEKYKVQVHLDTKTVHIPDKFDSAQVHAFDLDTGLVRTCNPVTIPPQSHGDIEVNISNIPHGETVVLEPLPKLPEFQLAGAKCLVLTSNTVFMQILNPTDQHIFLPANLVIASASIISDSAIFSLDVHQGSYKEESCEDTSPIDLDFDLSESDLSNDEKNLLRTFLIKNRKVFAKDISELGHTHLYQHRIETGDAVPVRKRFYRQSPQVNEEMTRQLNEMLEQEIIEESNSEWQSPVVMVKKKSGELRFCVDYRELNKRTKPFFFPLPRLEDVFDSLGSSRAQIFSTLDLLSGYWQVGMDPETAHKAAFVTPTGVYQWKRLPFGLANSPSSFMNLLTHVLKGLTYKIALVYVDDILVYSGSFREHLQHLQLVFDRLISAGLTLKISKCSFAQKQVIYLGHKITKHGVEVDVAKTETVKSFPVPKTQRQIRSFLGLCNYYKKFVKNYSHICTPLHNLLRQDVKFKWTPECQQAFDKLKTALTSAPILAYPDPSKPFILTTDASQTAIGYILGQRDAENREQVIAYGGRSLSKDERKWPIHELECLAVLEGIKYYHVYLANNFFEVYTDNRAVSWLSNIKLSTGRLARWSVLLQGYNFQLFFRKGANNQNADALSRREYPSVTENLEELEDSIPSINEVTECTVQPNACIPTEITFLYSEKPETKPPTIAALTADPAEDAIPDNIGQLQKECPDFKDIFLYLSERKVPQDKTLAHRIICEANQYGLNDGVLYHFYQPRAKGKNRDERYIRQLACPRKLRHDVLVTYHELGHFGFDRTYRAIQQKYYFPGMYQAVADFVKRCDPCQRAKQPTHAKKVPLTPMPITDTFSKWHIDIIGPFKKPTKEGFKYILIIVDSFSKWTEAFPLKSENSKEIAGILYKDIFSRFGAPHSLVSDRGQPFMSKLVSAVNQIFNVSHAFTSSYHPQTNSVAERTNKTIIQCLRTLVDENQENWSTYLPGVLMAFRMTPSATSEFSPYYLVFAKEMNLPLDCSLIPRHDLNRDAKSHIRGILDNLKIANAIAKENIQHAQEKQKRLYDRNAELPKFELNDLVLLYNPKIPKGLSSKLHCKYDGPFYIADKGDNHTYKLRRCSTNAAIKSMINANRLKPYHSPDLRRNLDSTAEDEVRPSQPRQPPNFQTTPVVPVQNPMADSQANNDPDTEPVPDSQMSTPTNTQGDDTAMPETHSGTDSNDIYFIDQLLRMRTKDKEKQYLVKWQGYSERTWEPASNIPSEIIREFHIQKTQKGKKRKRKRQSCFQ